MKLRLDRSAAVLTAAIVLAYAGAADAQNDPRPGTAARSGEAAAVSSPQTRSPANAQAAVRSVRASELIGMDVRDGKGERIGDVNDLIVDLTSGRVMYAVVGIGGFLGIGEKVSALPMNQVRLAGSERNTAAGAARDATGRAGNAAERAGDAAGRAAGGIAGAVDNDGVRGDKGPIGSDRTAEQARREGRVGVLDNDGVRGDKGHIGSDRPSATERATDRAALGRAGGGTDANANRNSDAQNRLSGRSTAGGGLHVVVDANVEKLRTSPNFDRNAWPDLDDPKWRTNAQGQGNTPRGGHLVRASQLMDADLRDAQGKDVGEIEDLVIDVRDGRVLTAVVDFDKAWTPDDKLVAVPVRSLRATKGSDELTFAGDKAAIERAPSFDKNRWPDLNQGKWRSEVERQSSNWRDTGGASQAQAPGSGMTGAAADRAQGAAASAGTSASRAQQPAATRGAANASTGVDRSGTSGTTGTSR